jgi:hypothetical protein
MEDEEFWNGKRVPYRDHPKRCQALNGTYQCWYYRTAIDIYCKHHTRKHKKLEDKKAIRMYRLEKWQHRVNELAEDVNIKSLRGEIGIIRMLL